MPSVDVLVAGAGPAGLTIARLLALRDRCVGLIEGPRRDCSRLEVVSPAILPIFEGLGVAHVLEDPLIARRCLGIRRRWGSRTTQVDDFIGQPGGRGFVIDRRRFDAFLRTEASGAGVEIASGAVAAVMRDGNAMVVKVREGSTRSCWSASLIVDATGRPASVARRLGACRLVTQRLVAERQYVSSHAKEKDEAVWLEIEGNAAAWQYNVTGPGERGERWEIRPGGRRGESDASRLFDASAAFLTRAAGDGWIAIGDAATAFDPISAQGLGHALSTALVGAGLILSSGTPGAQHQAAYSDAVITTFMTSEAARRQVYLASIGFGPRPSEYAPNQGTLRSPETQVQGPPRIAV